MRFNQYIKELRIKDYKWILSSFPEIEVYSFRPYSQNISNWDSAIVYMGYLSKLKDVPTTNNVVNFLCIKDTDFVLEINQLKLYFPNANIVTIYCKCSLEELFDVASDCFLNAVRYNSQINHLLSAFNANKGLQYLIDEACAITRCPIIIMDNSYKILAMYNSQIFSESNSDLETQRNLGYATERTIQRMKRDKIYEQLRKFSYPLYTKPEDEQYGWLNVLVYAHGIEMAEIGMMEYNHTFNHYDFEFLNFLKQLVSWQMQQNDFYINNRGMMHSVFLAELLDQKIPNQQIVRHRKKLLNWKESPYMYIMTVFQNEMSDFNQRAEIFAIQMQNILPNSRWVIYHSNLVMLIMKNTVGIDEFMPESPFYKRLELNHLYAIVSNCFSDFLEIRKYYEQTISINNLLPVIDKKKAIYIYNDYVFYHIGTIIAESYDLRDFYHPAIIAIRDYDKQNNTSYLETLTQYLIHIDNPSLCAKNLFIHKNTFFYRMNKIREQFHLDLNDGVERLKLHLTLEFMKLE